MDKMIAAASRFNVDRVRQEDVAKIGGAPPEEVMYNCAMESSM
jgi:hypothetical protein